MPAPDALRGKEQDLVALVHGEAGQV
jgi:hypothetical protein